MAKLPRYMKNAGWVKDRESGHLVQKVKVDLYHPLFLWDLTKQFFQEYAWWHPRFWVLIIYIYWKWINRELFEDNHE